MAGSRNVQQSGTASRGTKASWPAVLVALAWIGATSFGGGSATIVALRQLCLRRGWLDETEFLDVMVLSKLTPGVSILAQALLIGRSAAGVPGMVAGVVGLMTPSVLITIGIAWLYVWVSHLPGTGALLHALAGVAGGFAVAMLLMFLRDLTRGGRIWRTMMCFLVFASLAWLIANPLIVMGVAVLAGVAIPSLFDDGTPLVVESAKPPTDGAEQRAPQA